MNKSMEPLWGGDPRPATTIYYNSLAPHYDRATAGRWLINRLLEPMLRQIPDVQSVLDLGAGTGQTIETILADTNPGRVVAVDISELMLERLRERYQNDPRVEVVQDSLDDYLVGPVDSPEQFDLVTAMGALEFVPHLESVLPTMADRIAPGGRVAFTYELHIPDRSGQSLPMETFPAPLGLAGEFTVFRWTEQEMLDLVGQQGLTVQESSSIPAYQRGPDMIDYGFIVAGRP